MIELLELTIDLNTARVTNRESEHREFKSIFDTNSIWKYAKTMVSFANKNGGVIFFGIKDKPRDIVGFNGNIPDQLVIANFLNEYFEPEIKFSIDTKIYGRKTVLYVLVSPSNTKPVICKKNKIERFAEKGKSDNVLLREGAIYYRYSTSTTEVKFPELSRILEDRVQRVFRSLVDNITLLNKVGYEKAAIVDAEDLSGNDKVTSVYITTETAKNINWIQKGRFSETKDSVDKAYYVTRQIEIKQGVEIEKPVDPSRTHTLTKSALTKEVKIINYINAVLWKLGILDNETFHIPIPHGKTVMHKFTASAKERILTFYPLDMVDRINVINKVRDEYIESQRK